jgi:hypothetical protein
MSKTLEELVVKVEDIRQIALRTVQMTNGGPFQIFAAADQVHRLLQEFRADLEEHLPKKEEAPKEPEPEPEKSGATRYSKSALDRMNKTQLAAVVEELGGGVEEYWTKSRIREVVDTLMARSGSEE